MPNLTSQDAPDLLKVILVDGPGLDFGQYAYFCMILLPLYAICILVGRKQADEILKNLSGFVVIAFNTYGVLSCYHILKYSLTSYRKEFSGVLKILKDGPKSAHFAMPDSASVLEIHVLVGIGSFVVGLILAIEIYKILEREYSPAYDAISSDISKLISSIRKQKSITPPDTH